jgi:hypothetical protein
VKHVEWSEWLSSIAVPMLIAMVVASRGLRTDERYLERWARSAGLELTVDAKPIVWGHLARSRRCRTVGGLIGFMTPIVYAALVTGKPVRDGGWSVASMLIGYLAGAFFAELVAARREPRAEPAPRPGQLNDYLPASVQVLQRGVGILGGALALAYPFVEPPALPSLVLPGPAVVGAFGASGVFTVLLLELLERRIAVRGQRLPRVSPAVEDALTSSSIHSIAGAGIALLLPNAAAITAVSLLSLTGSAAIAPALGFLLFAAFIGSLAYWLRLAKPHGFRVPRDQQHRVSG